MTAVAKSGRERVLHVLTESLEPLSSAEVTRLSALPAQQAKNRLSDLMRESLVVNVGWHNNALYTLTTYTDRPVQKRRATPVFESRIPTATYTGEKPLPERPGSMKAYTLPSLENGNRVDRKKPILIGALPEKRV